MTCRIRRMLASDLQATLKLRNYAEAKDHEYLHSKAVLEEHQVWWDSLLMVKDSHPIIAEIEESPAGLIIF